MPHGSDSSHGPTEMAEQLGGTLGTLDGKVALVTGGASGIGRATARRLRSEGAEVVISDLDESGGAAVAEEIAGVFVRADAGSPDDWSTVVERVRDAHGALHIAHLNAGIATGQGDITAVTDDRYSLIMRANVDGVFYGLRAVVPLIESSGGGAIVATASLAGLIGFSPDPVYCATKHAVVGYVRSLAPQLEGRGITINAICPGMVDPGIVTDELRQLLEEAQFPMMEPEQIAEAVYRCVVGEDTGQAYVCQVGIEPTAYRFSGVPGPQGEVAGRTPPPGVAAEDQLSRGVES
ncbi:MAG TPA: SDR family oxidoreductase [Acidimicrobiales bacterium]|nr:SDR family oxidoreductase [Acidimicrobiales bacterium]